MKKAVLFLGLFSILVSCSNTPSCDDSDVISLLQEIGKKDIKYSYGFGKYIVNTEYKEKYNEEIPNMEITEPKPPKKILSFSEMFIYKEGDEVSYYDENDDMIIGEGFGFTDVGLQNAYFFDNGGHFTLGDYFSEEQALSFYNNHKQKALEYEKKYPTLLAQYNAIEPKQKQYIDFIKQNENRFDEYLKEYTIPKIKNIRPISSNKNTKSCKCKADIEYSIEKYADKGAKDVIKDITYTAQYNTDGQLYVEAEKYGK